MAAESSGQWRGGEASRGGARFCGGVAEGVPPQNGSRLRLRGPDEKRGEKYRLTRGAVMIGARFGLSLRNSTESCLPFLLATPNPDCSRRDCS